MDTWWVSHAMAPAPIQISSTTIRVYLGCWDEKKISRIGYVDVSAKNPLDILSISNKPILDLGEEGAFDENGVFPGHINIIDGQYFLFYTGFQLGHKVPHYNFGGLAISADGDEFKRVSRAPILDRSDEGLSVRAGQSILYESDFYHSCYSAGTKWLDVGGKLRPIYDVYYQKTKKPDCYEKRGTKIVSCDQETEHGLGRPHLYRIDDEYLVCYTRRTLNMQYHLGCAISNDLNHWHRKDEWIGIPHGTNGSFDDQMVYFPAFSVCAFVKASRFATSPYFANSVACTNSQTGQTNST